LQPSHILVRCGRSRCRSPCRVRSVDRYASAPFCPAACVAPNVTSVLPAHWQNRSKSTVQRTILCIACELFSPIPARLSRSAKYRRPVLRAQHRHLHRTRGCLFGSYSPRPNTTTLRRLLLTCRRRVTKRRFARGASGPFWIYRDPCVVSSRARMTSSREIMPTN